MSRLLGLRLAVLLCFASLAWAQFDTASVLGTVRDQTGGVVKDSKVTLRNIDTGVSVTASTDTNGDFQFFNVRIGSYSLRAEATGFKAAVAERFTVTVGARQRVDL